MSRRMLVAACVGLALVAATVVVAILRTTSLDGTTVDGGAAEPVTSTGRAKPGDLVSAQSLPDLNIQLVAAGGRASRIVYRSTEGDTGALTTVSGTAFVPPGDPPGTGWPVVAFGHPTTGIDQACAPSTSPTLLGLSQVVGALVARGYAVVMPDFQGLGEPGVHPYLDARTAGLDIIDGVRALRKTFPHISRRWAAIGQSQGAGATWAANEQAGDYAPELRLLGTSSISPPADVTDLVSRAVDGSLTQTEGPVLQAMLVSLARLHPHFDLDLYRSGSAVRNWRVLSSCAASDRDARVKAIKALKPADLRPRTPAAAARLRTYIRAWALPQKRLSAPLSVAYGERDDLVDYTWTTRAIDAACRKGGTIESTLFPDRGHSDIEPDPQVRWIADRFAGRKAPDSCPGS